MAGLDRSAAGLRPVLRNGVGTDRHGIARICEPELPHCAAFKAYAPELQRRRPDLRITLIPVDTDPAAQRDLVAISRQAKIWPPGVPTFVVGNRVLVGFGDPASSGPELLAFLDGSAAAGLAGRTEV